MITGTIGVESGSTRGTYSTDLSAANGHLDNSFNATKVNNTLQTEIGAETAAETATELGVQAYEKWGGEKDGTDGSSQKASSSVDAVTPQQAQKDGYLITSDGQRLAVHSYGEAPPTTDMNATYGAPQSVYSSMNSAYPVDHSTGMPAVNQLYWNDNTGQFAEMPLSTDQYYPGVQSALHSTYGSVIASVPLNATVEGGSPTNTTISVPDDGVYHATGLANSTDALLFSKEGSSDYYTFTEKGIRVVTGEDTTGANVKAASHLQAVNAGQFNSIQGMEEGQRQDMGKMPALFPIPMAIRLIWTI